MPYCVFRVIFSPAIAVQEFLQEVARVVSGAMTLTVDKQFSSHIEAVSQARQCVNELAESLSKSELQNLSLLVSELVTNSVLHAGLLPKDLIGLKIYLSVELIRTEVRNPGSGFELPTEGLLGGGPLDNIPYVGQTSGWGLQLVAKIADRWGMDAEATDGLTLVWFELDRASGTSVNGDHQ